MLFLATFQAFILSFSFILYIDEVPFLNLGISKANLLIGLKTHTVPCTIVKTIYLSIFQFQSFFDELQGRGTDASN
ncbi:unnamed protein product [Rhizophagus irregularis]|nr:unnamed protein product [Rhizophagus irregularis]